jgi:hypothetical protein
LRAAYRQTLFNLDTEELPEGGIVFRGPGAWPLVQREVGTHLFCPEHESLVPVQVLAWPLAEDADPVAVLREQQRGQEEWQRRLLQGLAALAEDPWRLLPVLTISQEAGTALDLRTCMSYRPGKSLPPWIETLSLPPELVHPEGE